MPEWSLGNPDTEQTARKMIQFGVAEGNRHLREHHTQPTRLKVDWWNEDHIRVVII